MEVGEEAPGLLGPVSDALRVEELPGRGRGYVAAQDIPACTLLMRERPLQASGPDLVAARGALARRVIAHPRFMGVCAPRAASNPPDGPEGVDPGAWHTAVSQVQHNAFGRHGTGGGLTLSLFLHVSICNHSCQPNASLTIWDRAASVYTVRDVRAGEEVCICYDGRFLYLPTALRQADIERVWGFTCACPECASPSACGDQHAGGKGAGVGGGYFDASGRLRKPLPAGEDGEAVDPVEVYEDLVARLPRGHWQVHVAREEALVFQLAHERDEFDLELLLEHLEAVAARAPHHSGFYRWWFQLAAILVENRGAVEAHEGWRGRVARLEKAADPKVAAWHAADSGRELPPPWRSPR